MPKHANTEMTASVSDLERVLNASVNKLEAALRIQGLVFFPNGIELITIKVIVGGITVELTVAGPKAKGLVGEPDAATSGPPTVVHD